MESNLRAFEKILIKRESLEHNQVVGGLCLCLGLNWWTFFKKQSVHPLSPFLQKTLLSSTKHQPLKIIRFKDKTTSYIRSLRKIHMFEFFNAMQVAYKLDVPKIRHYFWYEVLTNRIRCVSLEELPHSTGSMDISSLFS